MRNVRARRLALAAGALSRTAPLTERQFLLSCFHLFKSAEQHLSREGEHRILNGGISPRPGRPIVPPSPNHATQREPCSTRRASASSPSAPSTSTRSPRCTATPKCPASSPASRSIAPNPGGAGQCALAARGRTRGCEGRAGAGDPRTLVAGISLAKTLTFLVVAPEEFG